MLRSLLAVGALFFFGNPSAQGSEAARVELLWVLDHSSFNERSIQQIKTNFHVLIRDLERAGIKYSGVILSSDLEKFDGEPVRQQGVTTVLHQGPDEVLQFRERVSLAYSDLFCNNCFSSPFWALSRFFSKVKSIKDVYRQNFFMPKVPLEVLIITSQFDHYRYFTKKLPPVKHYGPFDFADQFVTINQQEEKRVRVHALTPECPHLIETSGDPTSIGPREAYRLLVGRTGGEMLSTNCEFDPVETLHQYANKIISSFMEEP
jgi:hypothetical protein